MFIQGYFKSTTGFILEIHDTDGGYDFTLYDTDLNVVDGGLFETEEYLDEIEVVGNCLAFVDVENEYARITDEDEIERLENLLDQLG